MLPKRIALALAGPLACVTTQGFAHAVCGARIFPVTLTMDDPGVADEASLPAFTYTRSGAAGGPGPTHQYAFNFEYDKRITDTLGVAVNYGWSIYQTDNAKTETGFSNLVITGKYSTCVSEEDEFVLGAGVQRLFGRTGTAHTGDAEYGATTPTLYAGKGLGNLASPFLRPIAFSGELSYAVADRELKQFRLTDPITNLPALSDNRGSSNAWFGAFSIQYSLPYLQAQVQDVGLGRFFGHLVPIAEFTWTSPASSPSNTSTTWTLAPGVIYQDRAIEVGVEALVPLNRAAGTTLGAVALVHLFLDDLFPNSIGHPIFR